MPCGHRADCPSAFARIVSDAARSDASAKSTREARRSKRIAFKKLQPADVLFFGSNGPKSSGSEIFHTAIYVGNGWFIQSSDYGVAFARLTSWYKKKFAWGRRPLHEAGLE